MKIAVDHNDILHGLRAMRRYAWNLIRCFHGMETEHRFRVCYFRFQSPITNPVRL